MKKLFMLIISLILIVSSCGSFAISIKNVDTNLSSVFEDKMEFTVSFPDIDEFEIINNDEGQRLKNEDFSYLMVPGKPMLPVKNCLFVLPPGAKFVDVDFEVGEPVKLNDLYNVVPTSPIVCLDYSNSEENIRLKEEWKKNYKETYSSNSPYPEKIGRLSGFGTLRKYSYASISICPFVYYPQSKQLEYYDSVKVIINYEFSSIAVEEIKSDTIADEKASSMFINFNEVKDLYAPSKNQVKSLQETYDYVIITTDELKNIVESSNFYNWKTSLGYTIKFVKITDAEITDQPGVDLAEQIRNFLREYYLSWEIKYVLIVGDYTTVPMRYCSPNPDWPQSTVPTDTYYADLSYPDEESWNSDNDKYYGVYSKDNPDFMPEVYVGRIPTSDIARLTYTIDKITTFEQDIGNWKSHALHGGAMLFYANEDHDTNISFDVDGARLVDAIERDIMVGWAFNHYSEQEGLSPSIFEWDALNEQVFTEDWRSGEYAVVNWAAHGAPTGIGRVIWDWDDGDGIPEHENDELTWGSFLNTHSHLENDHPSIVFAVSCNVGYPEPTGDGNLGIDMLTKELFGAAVAVCSATRGAAVSADWVASHAGAEALCYEFNNYMIKESNRLGMALLDSKAYVHYNFGWDHHYEFMNMYDYNLYGDPAMIREGAINSCPSRPTIDGPISGNPGVKYEYKIKSIDPTDDNIYYTIDWGDDNIDDKIGPYLSGEEVTISHTWNSRNTFNIRVKAIDENGDESAWSSLEVSIPRIKVFDRPFFEIIKQLLKRILINENTFVY